MAANVTIIGRGARVRGRIVGTAGGDLEILGFVEGEVSIAGDVTIDATGIVGANVTARKLVVRGAVRGDLTAEEVILLEDGARVAGDVKAPRVAVAPGALVRGYLETGQTGHGHGSSASRAAAARPLTAASPRQAPAAQAPAKAPVATQAPAKVAAAAVRLAAGRQEATDRGARRPPPPIVPVLKRAKGQIATKKKER